MLQRPPEKGEEGFVFQSMHLPLRRVVHVSEGPKIFKF